MTGEVRTSRLLLRRPTAADLDAIYEVHAAPETNQFNPAGPMEFRAAAEQTLEAWSAHWDAHGFGYWAASSRDQAEKVLGFGGITRKDIDGRSTLNLYFRFEAQAWGRGFATELANAALWLAFDVLGESEVVGVARANNQPSIRVLTRLGMSLNGTLDSGPGVEPSLIFSIAAWARQIPR
jgi:RimJ/RimL family protein N-acetyltransferase